MKSTKKEHRNILEAYNRGESRNALVSSIFFLSIVLSLLGLTMAVSQMTQLQVSIAEQNVLIIRNLQDLGMTEYECELHDECVAVIMEKEWNEAMGKYLQELQ